ncbi:arylsulfatase [Akkermansiaceae bacterium]|nr:arylsulfatase [Akkermansiaceae bacterium]
MPRTPQTTLLVSLLAAGIAFSAPNIIFILADDMGYGDPAYAGGKIPTPHLDRMAKEGMDFTDAHTSSAVCTPTRYGILTGRYNWRSPMKKGVLNGFSDPLIPESRMTVAKLLGNAGYRSSVIGKWHLGLAWEKLDKPKAGKGPGWDIDYSKPARRGPLALGFTEDFLFPASLDMPPYVYLRNDKPIGIPTVTKAFKQPNRPGPATEDFEAADVLTDLARESREFIARQTAEKPFFLYLPLTSPHTPLVPSEKWQGKSGMGDYADFMMETDWVVGEVLAELDARGIAENTLVIFTSDNGCSPMADIPDLAKMGHLVNGPLRGHKADIFEGGHRVPFLVRWPEKVKAGSKCPVTVCTTDFFATAADVAGMEFPETAAEDSFSMLPLLDGKEGFGRKSTIHHSINGSFAIREGKWKLILCPGSGGWSDPKPGKAEKGLYPVQLYDLEADLAETNNLAENDPERVKALADLLSKSIRDGRSTPGAKQENDGWPGTTPAAALELLPQLKP